MSSEQGRSFWRGIARSSLGGKIDQGQESYLGEDLPFIIRLTSLTRFSLFKLGQYFHWVPKLIRGYVFESFHLTQCKTHKGFEKLTQHPMCVCTRDKRTDPQETSWLVFTFMDLSQKSHPLTSHIPVLNISPWPFCLFIKIDKGSFHSAGEIKF